MSRLTTMVVVLCVGTWAVAQTTQPATRGMREWRSPAMIASHDERMREYLVRRDDLERQYTQAKQNMPEEHPTVQKLKRELDDLRDRIETYAADYNVKTPESVWLADRERLMRKRQAQVLNLARTLNNLKQRYQFKLRDLTQDLRDKAIKLTVDGMAPSGGVSTKEIELTASLKRRMALAQSLADVSGLRRTPAAHLSPARQTKIPCFVVTFSRSTRLI